VFDKVLVANRGEIACRILRTCERLGIKSVAVFSDADVGAPHVALADEAFRLGGPALKESYLDIEAIIAAVGLSGAQAVHPGYGLLSENPKFARAVSEAGARFIGPSPGALADLGDKVKARALAQQVGLNPPPGTEEPVTLAGIGAAAQRLGFPLLVKAAAGGGGIGMHRVNAESELEKAFEVATTRATAAFGDGRVYLEKYLTRPRHIELQLARDRHGQCWFLGERECSIQRRHQKIIEESPSPAGFLQTASGRARLDACVARAKRLLEACDYENLATVEFVADETGDLYFLEVNARLQVEHPVSEMRSGLDLVELGLRIASGEKLGQTEFAGKLDGHAIEARLYAEDPDRNFMPQPGKLVALTLPVGEGVRVDSGVALGDDITPHYDPLLLKVIAHGADRAEARARLDRALAELVLQVEGKRAPRVTNQQFLRKILASESFVRGDYDTALAETLAAGTEV
jgi:acetyl/propionyl-CoA carboxylase alpha subunit